MSAAELKTANGSDRRERASAEPNEEHSTGLFQVLVHTSGRHSIWPARSAPPAGWRVATTGRSREQCLAYVRDHWAPSGGESKPVRMDFGLMFFGGGEEDSAREKYELIVHSARLADSHGLSSIWLPERHFNPFGCLYPNPVVLHAALARETQRIRLRAGSVVLPLHQPIRVVEDWSIVDNLSGGRVEVSFAPGWSPDDFALYPDRFSQRYDKMYEGIEIVRKLWRGEKIPMTNGRQETFELRTYPRPVQRELQVWVTAAQSDESFRRTGAIGAGLLTHMFDQDVALLAEKIEIYKKARRDHGHDPNGAKIGVALHTFIASDETEVRSVALPAYARYLKANVGMLKNFADSRGRRIDVSTLTGQDLEDSIGYLFDKFLAERSLLGTVESCGSLVCKLAAIGVHEVACLVDFGPESDAIRGGLENLCRLASRFAQSTRIAPSV